MHRRMLWPLLSPETGLGHSSGDVCGNEDMQPTAQMIALGRLLAVWSMLLKLGTKVCCNAGPFTLAVSITPCYFKEFQMYWEGQNGLMSLLLHHLFWRPLTRKKKKHTTIVVTVGCALWDGSLPCAPGSEITKRHIRPSSCSEHLSSFITASNCYACLLKLFFDATSAV